MFWEARCEGPDSGRGQLSNSLSWLERVGFLAYFTASEELGTEAADCYQYTPEFEGDKIESCSDARWFEGSWSQSLELLPAVLCLLRMAQVRGGEASKPRPPRPPPRVMSREGERRKKWGPPLDIPGPPCNL